MKTHKHKKHETIKCDGDKRQVRHYIPIQLQQLVECSKLYVVFISK